MEGIESDNVSMGVYHPHTCAKHVILKAYLDAWFNIMRSSQGDRRIVYLDGFAGSGIYDNGEYGSPIIALKCLLEHVLKERILDGGKEFVFYFIDIDASKMRKLKEMVNHLFPQMPSCVNIVFKEADFETEMTEIFEYLAKEGVGLAPTFAFIDPYGFSDTPFRLLKETMRHRKCEIMVTFMSGFINRFINAPDAEGRGFDELLESTEWRQVRAIQDSTMRRDFILGLYRRQLETKAGIRFVRSFEMKNRFNQVEYDLVFGTNHLRGLEVMKAAMWKIDPSAGCRFSDRTDPDQATLLDFTNGKPWVPTAAGVVFAEFRGKRARKIEVWEFVTGRTPFPFKAKILSYLESTGKIVNVEGRERKGTYPDGCIIEFAS